MTKQLTDHKNFVAMKKITIGVNTDNGVGPRVDKTDDVTTLFPTYGYIIIDQKTSSDPSKMIYGMIGEANPALKWIRENSHRYVGKKTANGQVTICQLNDSNSAQFADGSSADINTLGNDVFMRLPRFFWRCTQQETDIFKVEFAVEMKPDDSWHEWDGRTLIGAYEAYVSNSKVYSTNGFISTSISQANFKSYARSRGTGYQIVDWESHCMMAVLFYAWYGNTNSQAICGSGTSSYDKSTGQTNILGMRDTNSTNGNSMSINFWGLENWWGNKSEWIDNVVVDARVWKATEKDGSIRNAGTGASSDGWIKKLLISDRLDMIPTEVDDNETIGYCGNYKQSTLSSRVVQRSITGGIASVAGSLGSSNTASAYGSRLLFYGNIIEEKDPSIFN